jgi:HD-GYP domain-containing protein (c-di-GMP phosphodiesterase class II)
VRQAGGARRHRAGATPAALVKLIPFSKQYLRIGEPLPFGLRDESGRLLLSAGVHIGNAEQLQALAGQALFADESEAADWYRRLAVAMNERLLQNATLREVASARPDKPARDVAAPRSLTLDEEWVEIIDLLDSALRDVRPGTQWAARLDAAHARARGLMQRRPDASLYLQVYRAGHSTERYSARHSMLAMLVCELAASMLGWPACEVHTLGRAALLMNVAMLRLQDLLAATHLALTCDVRDEIARHPEQGAAQLARAGLGDALLIEVVRRHHELGPAHKPLAELSAAERLARLLRRVDIFTAKLSCRATRVPMSPVAAAREACLGADGKPDEIGGALLKAVGMYPPGSFVELASGEVGIVLARGRRANLPYVASLVSAAGTPLGEPALRDTLDQRHSVKAAVAANTVRVRPPHERLLAMR